MTVSRRLFIGFTLVTLLAIIVGAVGIVGMRELRKDGLSMYEHQVIGLEYLGRATGMLKQTRLRCSDVVISSYYDDQKGAADAKKQFESSSKEFNYWMNEAYKVASTEELIRFHEIITTLFNDVYMPNAEKINKASIRDMSDHVDSLQLKVLISYVNDVNIQLDNLIIGMMDLNAALAKQTSEDNDRTTQSLILVQYIMLAAAVLIAVVVTLYITKDISTAYTTIDEQNKTILSSIDYASKIQKNLLPRDIVFDKAFSDYSIIWSPRDIVGGDIYWMKNFDEGSILCVCDCTGHGTPGALLTMLIVSAFETAVSEKNYKDTARIIWLLDQRLANVLNVSVDDETKNQRSALDFSDGCDLAVLFIANDGSVTLSSGNMHVFICDGKETQQIKGQKLRIGEGVLTSKEDVRVVKIPANPDNKFYIASDGLYDQIGGESARPFGYKTLKQIILENHNEKQVVISEKIREAFESHRGEQERRDDVELITFKA